MRAPLLTAFCLLGLLTAQLQAADPDDAELDKATQNFAEVTKKMDYVACLDMMYPPILDGMGGKAAATASAQASMKQVNALKIVIVSWELKKPYQYVTSDKRRYVIMPYEMLAGVQDKHIRQTGYQLGIKDPGSKWYFVDGDTMTPALFRRFLPDFPSSVNLPSRKQTIE